MKNSKWLLSVIFAFASVTPSAVSFAETIHLVDGSSITGKIKSIGPKEVVIVTVIGEVVIDGAKILKVDGASTPTQLSENEAENLQIPTIVTPPVKSYPDYHIQQKNGFGFGPGISSILGISLFYDHNLSGKSQLHVQLNGNAGSRSNLWGEELIKTSRSMILTTYRYFPAANNGFYMGAGGGYANSTLKYESSSLFGSTPYKYTSSLSGVFLLGEVGWQGKDGYYFNVGFQPAGYISSKDDYDVKSIPNTSNHRAVADEEHDNLKILSQLSVGFGWFF